MLATATEFKIGQRVKVTGSGCCNGGVGETGQIIARSNSRTLTVKMDNLNILGRPVTWHVYGEDLMVLPSNKSNKSHAGSVLQKMKRNQNSDVLKHLIKRGNLSQYEANSLYRVTRLASRVHEIKQHGIGITAETRHDLTGKRYVRYFLAQ
jgi:hypothetical protein